MNSLSSLLYFFSPPSAFQESKIKTSPSTKNNNSKLQIYTRTEVAQRSTVDHPLLIVNGLVYDLGPFIDSHPGGDIILDYHGQDATRVMQDFSIHQHSESSYDMLADYLVGKLMADDDHGNEDEDSAANDSCSDDSSVPSLSAGAESDLSRPSSARPSFIDCNKPLFWQLWTMDITAAEYNRQVHRPKHLAFTARFFANPVLEFFSRTSWWAVPALWLPVSLYFIWQSYVEIRVPGDLVLLGVASGLLLWSLLEYCLHRFLFHLDEHLPDNKLAIMTHFTLHGVHHFLPMDKYRLVFPPVLTSIFAYLILSMYDALLGAYYSRPLFAGSLLGYVTYDMCHYYLHHGISMKIGYLKSLRSYHLDHHYKDFMSAFGITSKFWDIVFNSLPTTNK